MLPLIRNKGILSSTPQRRLALNILEDGIRSVLPKNVMSSNIYYDAIKETLTVHNKNYAINGRVFVIGAGKAADAMAYEFEKMIGFNKITEGIVSCKKADFHTVKVQLIETGHPTPDQKSIFATKQILELKNKYNINAKDTVICLLSGGGSSMMSLPVHGITLDDQVHTTDILLRSGASIRETNIIRKHISQVKGGLLGKYFQGATVISFILSDVLDDDISSIASGPTAPDNSTFDDAHNIIKKYDVIDQVPRSVSMYIEQGTMGRAMETSTKLYNCHNHVIGNNTHALEAMSQSANKEGLRVAYLPNAQEGDPNIIALQRLENIQKLREEGFNTFIMGAEMTPIIPKEHGVGGRNQHYIAAHLLEMQTLTGSWTVASINSDGHDYVENVAGAIIDNEDVRVAKEKRINIQSYVDRYDSHTLFKRLDGCLIQTGVTHTNVCDLVVYIFS